MVTLVTGLSSTVTSRVTVPRVSCQILSVYLPGGTLSRANSPLAPVAAKNGCSATTTQARIQVWRSQSIRTISGFLPHTYWSMLMARVFLSGGGPAWSTAPFMDPATAGPTAKGHQATASATKPIRRPEGRLIRDLLVSCSSALRPGAASPLEPIAVRVVAVEVPEQSVDVGGR